MGTSASRFEGKAGGVGYARLAVLPQHPPCALPDIVVELPGRVGHRPPLKAMSPRYEGKPVALGCLYSSGLGADVPYRVSSLRRRLFLPVLAILASVGVLMTFTAPNGTRLANVARWSVLLAWAIAMSWRWWRSSPLLASPAKVTIRTTFQTN